VSADALVALATERANRVAAVFLGSTQLGAARLEVLAAAIGTPPESGGAAPAHYCRAVFHLR
jgi:hypothetical protein